MKRLTTRAAILLGLIWLLQLAARASITIQLGADTLKDVAGNPMPTSGLVVLVASTLDSQFGSPTATSFVSGDDIEVARFDLSSTEIPGLVEDLAILTLSGDWGAGDPLAIFWYPTLTIDAVSPGASTPYGFYRDPTPSGEQGTGLDGSDPWFTPADGATLWNLLFLTSDAGGASTPPGAGNASFVIPSGEKIIPQIGWLNPADIIYGTALGTTELNATSSVDGSFDYSPPFGATLNAGFVQSLSVTFTPNNTDVYSVVTTNVSVNVLRKGLTVTADNKSRNYGVANPTLTGTISGIRNNDDIAASYSTFAGASSPVGTYAIVPALSDPDSKLGNYAVTTNNGSLTVTPALLTGTADDKSRLYGETNPLFTVTYSGFVNGENAGILSGTLIGIITAETNSPVGTYPITVSGQIAPNYNIQYVEGALTITATPFLVAADNASRAYGQPNPAFGATMSGFVNGEDSSALGGTLVLSDTADASSPVGSYAIAASGLTSTNYAITFSNGMLSVTGAVLSVTANDQSRIYGAANPVLTVSYHGFVNGETTSVLSGSPILSTTATNNSATGTYLISAAQGTLRAANYSFSFVGGTLTVTPAVLTVRANDQSRTYGATDPVLTVTYSGFLNGDTTSVLSGNPAVSTTATINSAVGTYPITPSQGTLAAANYTFAFSNGVLTITKAPLTVKADDKRRTYGATNPVLTVSYLGLAAGDTTSVLSGSPTLSTSATTNSAVGNFAIGISQGTLSAANYSFSLTNGTLTVTPAVVTVRADDKTRIYGATNPLFTVSYSGFVNGQTTNVLSGSPIVSTTAATNGAVGSYPVIPSQGTLNANNYSFGFSNGSLTVTAAVLRATADGKTRVYGATNPVFTATYTGFVNGDTNTVLSGSPAFSTTATNNSTAGSYPITISQGTLSANNYTFGGFTNGTLTVTKAILTVKADDKSKVYGSTNPVLTVSYTGFANGEGTNVLSGSPTRSTAATTNSAVGTYPIAVGQGTLSTTNYTFSLTNGTLTVTKATLGVTANNKTRVYGTTNPIFTVTFNGFKNNDTTSVLSGSPALSTTAITNSPVGTYSITSSQGTLSATNYSFSLTNGTLTVTAAVLRVAADNKSRVYGATNPVFTASYIGLVAGDTTNVLSGSPSLSTTAKTSSSVGAFTITISKNTLSATNYTFSPTNGILTITQAVLTVTADSKSRVYGAANPAFTVTYSGFVNGDTTKVLSGSPNVNTTATTNTPVGAYPITPTLGTLSAVNYSFRFVNGTLTITKAVLGVAAKNTSRAYGATNPLFTATCSGFLNGDGTNVLSGNPAFATTATTNSLPGTYPLTISQGTLSAINYSFAFTNGILTVTKATLTVKANDKSRVYGATNPVLTVTYSGFVNGDGTNVLSGAPTLSATATNNSAAGNYSITMGQGTLSATNYSFSLSNGTLTVTQAILTVRATDKSRLYGASNPAFAVTYSGLVTGDTTNVLSGSPAVNATATTNSAVGTYPIIPSLGTLSATNYAFNFTNGTLTVTKATLTVKADDQTRSYGALNPPLTVTHSGFLNGETANVISGSQALSTTAATNSALGTYPIAVGPGTLSATNYAFIFTNGILTVIRATLTVAGDDQSRVYGATNPALTVTYSGFVNGETNGVLSGAPSLSTAATTNSAVGSYPITVTQGTLNAINYTFNLSSGTLTVTQAILTVTADDQTRLFGAPNPPLTATYSGFANGDTTDVVSGSPDLSTTAAVDSPVGAYPITFGQGTLAATNYSLSFVDGTLTVTEAPQPSPLSPTETITINIGHIGQALTVSWNSIPGATYRVQYKNSLNDPEWRDLITGFMASELKSSATDTPGTVTRFYRVVRIEEK